MFVEYNGKIYLRWEDYITGVPRWASVVEDTKITVGDNVIDQQLIEELEQQLNVQINILTE